MAGIVAKWQGEPVGDACAVADSYMLSDGPLFVTVHVTGETWSAYPIWLDITGLMDSGLFWQINPLGGRDFGSISRNGCSPRSMGSDACNNCRSEGKG
ncbi:hypothetical protein DCO57_21215 [Labrenzia sp. 011]|nr:hypothetical protein DCO57_21215 [Labrenzia sp. 011]